MNGFRLGAIIFFGLCLGLFAGQRESSSLRDQGLPFRTVTLKNDKILLSEALAELAKQTGNRVADRRRQMNDPVLRLDLDRAGFWPALENIARQANARLSFYQTDGTVALIEGPYHPVPISYHGPFRTAVKRLTLARDLETRRHSCSVHLDVAWEPWFEPFYLEVGPGSIRYAPDNRGQVLQSKVPGRGQEPVAGRTAMEVEVPLPAPPRTCPRLELLRGSFQVIGPVKMLNFSFADLKPIKAGAVTLRRRQEGVTVSLTQLAVKPDRWTVDVLIENPPGGPKFDSYQSWLDNNRIYLEKGEGPKRQEFFPNSADEAQLGNITASRAALRYHFTTRQRRPPPGRLEDWRLVYRTPGRIVEVAVPYEFKDLPLP